MFFSTGTFRFLADLTEHNDRDWFNDHRDRYEKDIKAPALAFIAALAPRMAEISPHIRVDARALFRIHRDTRFSHDKSPYKTHLGLHFRHDSAKDVHAPGFYLHVSPDESFMGMGLWRPDGPSLTRIRSRVVKHPDELDRVAAAGAAAGLSFTGDSLTRVPKPWTKEHPLADALRRKDWILSADLDPQDVLSDDLLDRFVRTCRAGTPLMHMLCGSLDQAF